MSDTLRTDLSQLSCAHMDDQEWGAAGWDHARQLERELAEVTKQRDELIKQSAYPIETMVNRFLSWQLPESVCADLCATTPKEGRYGTNLLSASEAKEMIEHLLGVKIQIEESVTNDTVIVKGGSHDDA